MNLERRKALFRSHDEDGVDDVSHVELFFDLIFVFAVTQLSHHLVEHMSVLGAYQTAILLIGTWWVWINTSWATNWLNPEAALVRGLLIAMMFAGAMLSASIPHAFDDSGLFFAVTFVVMQVGRTLFMLWALHEFDDANHSNFERIACWQGTAAVFWIAGGVTEGWWRVTAWTVAIVIESSGPGCLFYVPGLGRSSTTDWKIEASDDPGRIARVAYTYLHLPIVAGIILTAVGDEIVLADTDGASSIGFALAILGGPALYLIGTMYFKRETSRLIAVPLSHLIGLGLLALAGTLVPFVEPLVLSAVLSACLVVVAIWERVSISQNPELAEPDPAA